MYCSSCGTAEQSAKTYCRNCGTWIGTGPPEERLSVMILFNLLSSVFAAAAAILLYLSGSGSPAHWSVYVAATLCVNVAVYQMLSFLFALNLRKRLKQGKSNNLEVGPGKQRELPAADTSQFVRPVGVTENTTELLEHKFR